MQFKRISILGLEETYFHPSISPKKLSQVLPRNFLGGCFSRATIVKLLGFTYQLASKLLSEGEARISLKEFREYVSRSKTCNVLRQLVLLLEASNLVHDAYQESGRECRFTLYYYGHPLNTRRLEEIKDPSIRGATIIRAGLLSDNATAYVIALLATSRLPLLEDMEKIRIAPASTPGAKHAYTLALLKNQVEQNWKCLFLGCTRETSRREAISYAITGKRVSSKGVLLSAYMLSDTVALIMASTISGLILLTGEGPTPISANILTQGYRRFLTHVWGGARVEDIEAALSELVRRILRREEWEEYISILSQIRSEAARLTIWLAEELRTR